MLVKSKGKTISDKELMAMVSGEYLPLDDPRYRPAWQGVSPVECNLVLEGGAMRGLYTAGVLDLFMDEGFFASTIIAVSAGALNACSYVAGMRGRPLYLNVRYCDDWRYYSMVCLLRTGRAFDPDFFFRELMYDLHPFDFDSFVSSPLSLTTVLADLEAGEAMYRTISDPQSEMEYLQASVSLPLITRIVSIDGKKFLDGGMHDSVPIEYSRSLGARKHIVVLTQDPSYKKPRNYSVPLARVMYPEYKGFVDAIKNRHLVYNRTYQEIAEMHESGEIFLLRPKDPVKVVSMEHSRQKLYDLYLKGYEDAKEALPAIRAYLAE